MFSESLPFNMLVNNLAAMNSGMGYNAGGTVTGGRNFLVTRQEVHYFSGRKNSTWAEKACEDWDRTVWPT